MTPSIILIIICTLLVVQFVFEEILDNINLKHFERGLPDALKGIYDDEKYQKAIEYGKTKNQFGLWSGLFSLCFTLFLLLSGVLGQLSDYLVGIFGFGSILSTLVFLGIFSVASSLIDIPFSYYSTFVIEDKFGFNKSSKFTFFKDFIVSLLMTFVVGGVLISVFLWLYQTLGPDFWVYFWVVAGTFIVLLNMFYTSLIVPLFNKLSPIEDGELKDAINDYAKKNEFSLTGIFVIDGSKRSSKANAFFSGIGKQKKVVLYDTLIQNHSKEELIAVLAHEIGHYKHKHIIYSMILSLLQIGAILWFSAQFLDNQLFSSALGASQNALHLNMIVFFMLFSPISTCIGVLMNSFSRKNEYEADKFAKDTYAAEPLIMGLKKLSTDNLSNINPHPLYVKINYSHPSLLQRIEALNK